MDFELRRAREKLEREQSERKEKAKLKLLREKRAREEAIRLRQALEEAQRERRLEAADAEAKANELEAETLAAARGVSFSRVLEAVPYESVGDKIKLPPSCFTELSEKGAFDEGPLHFSLSLMHYEAPQGSETSQKDQPRKTHAGALEFTAEENFVELPMHCWNNLFREENSAKSNMVEVRYVWLPKGTYAKLQSVEYGFSDIPNHKAVLETSLRKHATLTEGDTLTVNHGVLTYHLRVLELKPSSSVSVLETDIEVDIIGPESADNENKFILRPLVIGKPESGNVDEGNYVYYKFSIDEKTYKRVSSKEAKIVVNLQLQTQEGDTDLYVSRHPLLFPTRHQHTWSSHDLGSKKLVMGSGDPNLGPGSYSVAVYGFKGTSKYEVTITFEELSSQNSGQRANSLSTDPVADDTVECGNCRRYVPARTVALHEAYCSRHNIVCRHSGCGIVLRIEEAESHVHCEKCGGAFQKGEEIEKHVKVFHEPLQCACGIFLEKEQMVQHQSLDCPLRLVTCQFCGVMVQAGARASDARDRIRGLSEHESVCGSRTAPCDSCGRSVMLKDMDIHQIAVHPKN